MSIPPHRLMYNRANLLITQMSPMQQISWLNVSINAQTYVVWYSETDYWPI